MEANHRKVSENAVQEPLLISNGVWRPLLELMAEANMYEDIESMRKVNKQLHDWIDEQRNCLYQLIPVVEEKRNQWKKCGKLHRDDDEPASITREGTRRWYRRGRVHRDGDKPAIINYGGDWVYAKNGKLHRDGDKPALIEGQCKSWYQHDQLHRDGDKPARIEGQCKSWYQHGRLHRDGGKPAHINKDGSYEWYRHGKLCCDGDKFSLAVDQ